MCALCAATLASLTSSSAAPSASAAFNTRMPNYYTTTVSNRIRYQVCDLVPKRARGGGSHGGAAPSRTAPPLREVIRGPTGRRNIPVTKSNSATEKKAWKSQVGRTLLRRRLCHGPLLAATNFSRMLCVED
nr:hypothetical protein Iba_chr04aCG19950 [Ipomoea batatas]